MPQCKWCGQSGWFLPVTELGLCKVCHGRVYGDIVGRGRVINDSIKIVEESKNLDTQLSRCNAIIEYAQVLLEYQKRGILTLRPSPIELIQEYTAKRDEIIIKGLEREMEAAIQKAALATSWKAKVNHLGKALMKVRDYRDKTNRTREISGLIARLEGLIHQTQFNGILEEARKMEFKGQKKKALDKYYEALYFLRNDNIDDSLQVAHISHVEGKIVEMGGEVPRDK